MARWRRHSQTVGSRGCYSRATSRAQRCSVLDPSARTRTYVRGNRRHLPRGIPDGRWMRAIACLRRVCRANNGVAALRMAPYKAACCRRTLAHLVSMARVCGNWRRAACRHIARRRNNLIASVLFCYIIWRAAAYHYLPLCFLLHRAWRYLLICIAIAAPWRSNHYRRTASSERWRALGARAAYADTSVA